MQAGDGFPLRGFEAVWKPTQSEAPSTLPVRYLHHLPALQRALVRAQAGQRHPERGVDVERRPGVVADTGQEISDQRGGAKSTVEDSQPAGQ